MQKIRMLVGVDMAARGTWRACAGPDKTGLASHTQRGNAYGMKMTVDIDAQKVEAAMAEYGVATKTEVIDLALRELLRKKAVDRLMASMGKFPNMMTNEKLEAPEKRHLARARRR